MPESSRVGLLSLPDAKLKEVVRRESITDVYDVEETVFARGKFANVRKATHKSTGVQYAAKYIKKRRRALDQTPDIHHEIAVLLKCAGNTRVVKLHEVYETNSEMILMLELAAGGELQHILDREEILDEQEARRAMRQILEGLSFLHQHNIAHLDLKPQNLLLNVDNNCDDIKLCDFGASRVLAPGEDVLAIIGTMDYVSPEVLNYEPLTLASDIWAIGVLTYVLLSGFTPFGADDKQQTYLNISQGIVDFDNVFEEISPEAIDFIKSTLVLDPRKRPSVQQLLQHPWLVSPSVHILNVVTNEVKSNTPISTPVCQRKGLTCQTETPKSQRKSYDNLTNGYPTEPSVRTYTNCLCAQCGTTCRHSPHTPVSKPPITVDRGILC